MAPDSIHRPFLASVYLPAILLGVPAQAILVLLPLYVLDLGGSVAAASAAVGFRGLGMMAADLPAGMLAARFGDRAIMLAATVLFGGAFVGYALVDSVALLFAIAFLHGAGGSSFLLGRMSYITAVCPPANRGRVIAMIAGAMRVSALIGPIVGGSIVALAGYQVAFLCAAVSVSLGCVCVASFTTDDRSFVREVKLSEVSRIVVEYRRVFATAGVVAVVFMLMRAARTVLIPLVGAHVGLDVTTIGLVVSISALVDVAMFYPAGMIMDARGRRATAIPSSIMMALSLAAMGFATGFYSLLLVAMLAGFANGLSTGIVMILGTDLAPLERRGAFLGVWRLLTDLGSAAGPLTIGALVAFAPLSVSALCIGGVGALGSVVIYRYVAETLNK